MENEIIDILDISGGNAEQATEALESVTLADVHQAVVDGYHVSMFGSALIAGAIIGTALFRRWA